MVTISLKCGLLPGLPDQHRLMRWQNVIGHSDGNGGLAFYQKKKKKQVRILFLENPTEIDEFWNNPIQTHCLSLSLSTRKQLSRRRFCNGYVMQIKYLKHKLVDACRRLEFREEQSIEHYSTRVYNLKVINAFSDAILTIILL